MLVWYSPLLHPRDTTWDGEEICTQGWADLKLGGINAAVAKRVRQ